MGKTIQSDTVLPYIPREHISPIGNSDNYQILDFSSSLASLHSAAEKNVLTKGQEALARTFLSYGGVAQFPGGIGLWYDNIFKGTISQVLYARLQELAQEVERQNIAIDCILTSDYSGIAPSSILGFLLQKDVVRIRKKNHQDFIPTDDTFAVRIDSYTGNGGDVLTLEKTRFAATFHRLNISHANVLFVDEILDTGTIIRSIHEISRQSLSTHYPFSLTGAVFILEKTYTNAAKHIHDAMNIPTCSGLAIEDLGLLPSQWIKISGINEALRFRQTSF